MSETTADIRSSNWTGLSWFAALLPVFVVNLLLAILLAAPFLDDQSTEVAREIQRAEIELNGYLFPEKPVNASAGKPVDASNNLETFVGLLPKFILFGLLTVIWIIASALWIFHAAPWSALRGLNILVATTVALTLPTLLVSKYWTSWRPELEGNSTDGFPTFTVAVYGLSLLVLGLVILHLISKRGARNVTSTVFFWLFGFSVASYMIMSLVFLYGGPTPALFMGTVNIVMLFLLLLFLILCGAICATYQRAGGWLVLFFILSFGVLVSLSGYREVPQNAGLKVTTTPSKRSQLELWLEARRTAQGNDNFPIFIVAASGGGLRAAMRTAFFLEHLRVHCPAAMRNVFAISAVSGGGIGALIYAANQKFMEENPDLPWRIGRTPESCRLSLADRISLPEDNSTPLLDAFFQTEVIPSIIGAGLFSDLFQRLLPPKLFPGADRSKAFIAAFQESWERAIDSIVKGKSGTSRAASREPCGARRFLECPSGSYWTADGTTPLLVFNTTSATDGSPVVLSNIDRNLLLGVDLIQPRLTQQSIVGANSSPHFSFRLISGASASAGFPIALPAAVFEDNYGGRHMLVDGGYFDNSGLATAVAIKHGIEQYFRFNSRKSHKVVIIHLHATEEQKERCNYIRALKTDKDGQSAEVVIGRDPELAHAGALFNARSARSKYTRQLILERQKSKSGFLQFDFELHQPPFVTDGTLRNDCDLYAPLAFYFSKETFISYKQAVQGQLLVGPLVKSSGEDALYVVGNAVSFSELQRVVETVDAN